MKAEEDLTFGANNGGVRLEPTISAACQDAFKIGKLPVHRASLELTSPELAWDTNLRFDSAGTSQTGGPRSKILHNLHHLHKWFFSVHKWQWRFFSS